MEKSALFGRFFHWFALHL